METELARQLRRLQHGDHSCMLYESAAEQRAAMLPFFVEGLARGERCLWIADDRSVDEVKSFLHEAGIDVAAEIRRDAFMILDRRETYYKDGAFDPHAMIGVLGETIRESLAMGFTGLRGSGEMTWALGDETGPAQMIEYEALLNDFVPGKPFVCICQYNKPRFVPSVVLDVLRTHHFAVVGELVCPNVYYEPSELFGKSTDARRVEWRLEQLRRAREGALALERAISAREAFFALASHELRTPVTALQLQLEIVANALAKGGHATEQRRLDKALERTRELHELAERMLDVTQLHARGVQLTLERVDLGDIVREVVGRLAPTVEKSRSVIDLELDSAEGQWDRSRIAEVVNQLLANALKYGAGGRVRVSVARRGKTATLIVRDHGIGIRAEDRARIFGPFQRAVSDHHYGGFGVGLWIAQQIVEAHRGSIDVDSSPGEGATFTVRLPCGSPEPE